MSSAQGLAGHRHMLSFIPEVPGATTVLGRAGSGDFSSEGGGTQVRGLGLAEGEWAGVADPLGWRWHPWDITGPMCPARLRSEALVTPAQPEQ